MALLLALTIYGVLPLLGISMVSNFLSANNLISLVALFIGIVIYYPYLKICKKYPDQFLLAILALLPWFTFITKIAVWVGINFPQTVLLLFLFVIPTVWIVYKYLFSMLKTSPLLTCFSSFWLLMVIYFIWFDHPIVHPSAVASGKASMSIHALTAVTLTWFSLQLGTYVAYWVKEPKRLLGKLTITVTIMTLILSITTIAFYPFKILTTYTDGVLRSQSLFFSPGQFAYYLAMLLIYLEGMYFYNKKNMHISPVWQKAVVLAIIMGFISLCLTISKNSISAFIGASVIFQVLLLLKAKNKLNVVLKLVGFPVLLLVGLFLFENLTGISIFENLSHRMNDDTSLLWRYKSWDYVLSDIDMYSVWLGHGLTAAVERMSYLEVSKFNRIFIPGNVHNDYLEFLYDFGIAGLIVFIYCFISLFKNLIYPFRANCYSQNAELYYTAAGLILIFLITCATGICFEATENPFWILIILLVSGASRISKNFKDVQSHG